MGYRPAPVQLNIAEGGYAEFRICDEYDQPIVTFGFAVCGDVLRNAILFLHRLFLKPPTKTTLTITVW